MVLGSLEYHENVLTVVLTGIRDTERAIVSNKSGCCFPVDPALGLSELGDCKPSHLPVLPSMR